MAEENIKAVEETEVEDGEIVEIEPVEDDQPKTEIPREPVDQEAEEQIEVVSDTPEAKKEDELEDYSKSVQKRINTLTRKLREAERGQDSAYQYAKNLAEENRQLKTKSQHLDRSYLMEAENRLKSQKAQGVPGGIGCPPGMPRSARCRQDRCSAWGVLLASASREVGKAGYFSVSAPRGH